MTGTTCPQCHATFEPTLTLRMLACVQYLMFRSAQLRAASMFARLERIESYLIERYNREPISVP